MQGQAPVQEHKLLQGAQAHFMAHERLEPQWLLYQYGAQCQNAFNQFVGLRCWDWKALLSFQFHQLGSAKL